MNDLNEASFDAEFLFHVPQPLMLDSIKCLSNVDESHRRASRCVLDVFISGWSEASLFFCYKFFSCGADVILYYFNVG